MEDSGLLSVLYEHKEEKGAVIPILQGIQEKYGYLPPEILERFSELTSIPLAQIYGVATFFAQFRFEPRGKHLIRVCHGTACHVNGAERISSAIEEYLGIKEKETTLDGKFSVENVACLG
ncbi:MAG: NAD(P)H-dependent oxidoreductase subunit E, partial [bacterium]